MGIRIFLHSINLVFTQLSSALRLSGLLYILSVVITVIGVIFYMPTEIPGAAPSYPWQLIPIGVATTAIYFWIAIAWHRFVLLSESPASALPQFQGDRMLAYLGRTLQMGLIGMVAGLIFALPYFVTLMLTEGNALIAAAGPLMMLSVISIITFRLAPILPAAAVGKPLGIRAAWAATAGSMGTIVALAVVFLIASVVVDLPTLLIQHVPAGAIFVLIWTSVTGWIRLMVGISILTTLYGVYVENRTIA